MENNFTVIDLKLYKVEKSKCTIRHRFHIYLDFIIIIIFTFISKNNLIQ